jgi:hypothetical protein
MTCSNLLRKIKMRDYKLVHISQLMVGDVVLIDGVPKTVCKKDLKMSNFMGRTLFGDSHNIGYKKILRKTRDRVLPKS